METSHSGSRQQALTRALLDYGARIPKADLFPNVVPEAATFATRDAFAFLLASCLDRGMRSEWVWTIPFGIRNALGHLDPRRLAAMELERLAGVLRSLRRPPRFMRDAPRTVREMAKIVSAEHDGDAAGIWRGKDAETVRATMRRVHGVGPQLAEMTLLLIERAFPGELAPGAAIEIKADVHAMRVLYRLGVAAARRPESATRAARQLNPSFPGALDGALWMIGRSWCHERNPECRQCVIERLCPRRDVGAPIDPITPPIVACNDSTDRHRRAAFVSPWRCGSRAAAGSGPPTSAREPPSPQ